MKNKIMVFALLCALMVGVVPLHHATKAYAATETTIVNDGAFVEWCSDNGLPSEIEFKLNDDELNRNIHYIVFFSPEENNCYYVLRFTGVNDVCKPYFSGQKFYINDSSSSYSFSWARANSSKWGNCFYTHTFSSYPVLENPTYTLHDKQIVFSTLDVYADSSCTDIVFERSVKEGYSFYDWCADAGLNCSSSTNESNTVLPYVFNDYIHIVRRTSADKYGREILTTIGNSIIGDNLSDYTLMVDDTGALQVYALYSGEEEQGYQLFVRNYIYDTDGWKLISFELFDTREDDDFIIELGEDSAINNTNLLAYTSVDIYDDGLNLLHPASTEYYDVNDILPDVPEEPEEPSVTPGPSGGGVGGTGLTLYRPEMTGKVVSSYVSLYNVPNGNDDDVLVDLLQGMSLTVHGWLSDESGKVWYYCTYKNVYEDNVTLFTGYVDSAKVGLTNGAEVEDGEDMTLKEKIMEITAFVGSVPLIIGALFSFLPPWCLTLTGIGFAIIAIIMIRRGTLG